MADLSGLSPKEYEQISRVLQRDQELRMAEDARVRQLKQELLCLRKRAALRPGLDPQKSCSRCLSELGLLVNRGALCPLCHKKVCQGCRQFAGAGGDWRCTYCYKQMQLKAISGEWMLEFGRLSACVEENRANQPQCGGSPVKTSSQFCKVLPEEPPNILRHDSNVDTREVVNDETNNVKSYPEDFENLSVFPKVSPWTDIDPEPTFPLRKIEIKPVGTFQPCRLQESWAYQDSQTPEEDFLSGSTSTVVDGSESPTPVCPKIRKGSVQLQKQEALLDPAIGDYQQPCIDSGRCSRNLVNDTSPVCSEMEEECQPPKPNFPLEEKQSSDESGNSLRSSPHGRLRMRNRSLSGGSEDGRQRKASVPQLSVLECFESPGGRLNNAVSEKDNSAVQDEDSDQLVAYHSRSQMSLSSFGGRSESITSVYSAAGGGRYGTVTVTGDVLFGVNYNYKLGALEINIKECRNLAAVDTKRNRSDPYVKVYLLPDRTKSGKRKTKVKKHTLNPVFDEILKFHVTVSELEIRTLWLSVWHSDRFGRNDFLGEAMLQLGSDIFENSGLKWYPLQERMEAFDSPVTYKGDLILALKYVPPDVTSRKFSKKPGIPVKGALEILIREARNLMATRSNGTSDPFCKSYLLPDKSKTGKQKTPVFKKSCNPKWNHTFVYDNVSLEDLQERCLELTVWDYDKITSNDFLGGVRLCLGSGKYQGRDVDWMDSVGEERLLWHTMLERPNTWIDGSLLLRPNMQGRKIVT